MVSPLVFGIGERLRVVSDDILDFLATEAATAVETNSKQSMETPKTTQFSFLPFASGEGQ